MVSFHVFNQSSSSSLSEKPSDTKGLPALDLDLDASGVGDAEGTTGGAIIFVSTTIGDATSGGGGGGEVY